MALFVFARLLHSAMCWSAVCDCGFLCHTHLHFDWDRFETSIAVSFVIVLGCASVLLIIILLCVIFYIVNLAYIQPHTIKAYRCDT